MNISRSVAVSFAAALVFASCSGGDSNTTPDTVTEGTDATEPAEESVDGEPATTETDPSESAPAPTEPSPTPADTATVTAIEDTWLYALSGDRFREIVARRQRVGANLALSMVDYLGGRLRDLTTRVNSVERLVRGGKIPAGLDLETAVMLAARGELDD